MAAQNTQLDYFMSVVLRQYCRSAEENDILSEEMVELRQELATLLRENADLRHRLKAAGLEVPPSAFVTEEDLAEIR